MLLMIVIGWMAGLNFALGDATGGAVCLILMVIPINQLWDRLIK